MRTPRLRIATAVLTITAALGLAVGVGVVPAYAVTDQICDQIFQNGQPDGECFNAWNGGPYVKTYPPNVTNDNFGWEFIHGRCNSTIYTTTNCPLSGMPAGWAIFQIRYKNSSTCVGDLNGSSTNANAASNRTCNDPNSGFGGDYGTVYVQAPCVDSRFTEFISVHWSANAGSGARFIGYNDPGISGDQMWQNLTVSGNSVCWINF